MKKIKQLAEMLAATDESTLEKIEQYEKEGRFNEHLDTNVAEYIPVDGSYKYITRNPFKRFYESLQRVFIVNPFMRYSNKLFDTQVTGRENLKSLGRKGCIVCCNHVNKLDCMAVVYALKGKKVYTSGAEFNNMKGFLGDMMRVGRMIPLSGNYAAMKNFDAAVTKFLKDGCAVTFYPERAEWWGYEKPRPLVSGAYKYAVKNGVPVLPVFITFRPSESAEKTALKKFVVNILPPIYPDLNLPKRQAVQKLMAENAQSWDKCYKEFYKV